MIFEVQNNTSYGTDEEKKKKPYAIIFRNGKEKEVWYSAPNVSIERIIKLYKEFLFKVDTLEWTRNHPEEENE